MRRWTLNLIGLGLCATGLLAPSGGWARPTVLDAADLSQGISAGDDGLPYLQCVPYARQVSGIQLYGDALTWWDKAEGRYARGSRPRVGAVMSFRPYGRMELGHVAAVSRVIDSRTVLLRHANWSPIDGRRGQIENDVRAVDVSPANDWSEVRVWYAPLGGLGTTHWPVNGFIYNRPAERNERLSVPASAQKPATPPAVKLAAKPAPSRIGADFLDGIVPEVKAGTPRKAARMDIAYESARVTKEPNGGAFRNDPIGRIIASRMR
ncbi:CHAP domain-containing protein [Novosphingobium cyanobacteriorum]|uniref:CHAP domain-containing protein n=1 Tax=Novosphingobium cyanobacteriorum TaxID=3024215 RepID=A0ABT6CII6_9SPHN|nr:CHAP domain-containing protein [Novosphingobium cyanobacteriorum]MDF8332162.1 CHAP domain-containing protein [Novosphingobium cyanobacteriorum]